MEYNELRILNNPNSPESILGIFGEVNAEKIEAAYENAKEKLIEQKEQGQKGDGSRVIPDQEFDQRMEEIEKAYKAMLELANEDEIDTAELDPDFPKKVQGIK